MPHLIGYADDSNGQYAHYNLLQIIHDFATANNWQAVRYNTNIDRRELVLKSTGYNGKDEIYLLFYCYQNADADIYNLAVGMSLGYIPENTLTTQPNVIFSSIPCHNRQIDYWLTLNPQRIAGALKVGTPVYESFYMGKFLPYAMPNQYPLPMICAGMTDGVTWARFSEVSHSIPYKGNRKNLRMWFNNGEWKTPEAWPWNNSSFITGAAAHLKDANGSYSLQPIILNDNKNIYGELDGIYHITGFDNRVENTLSINNETYIVMQDVARTGANDYYALKMEV